MASTISLHSYLLLTTYYLLLTTYYGLDHLLAQLHGRREGLGIPPEDVAEVNVEERARGAQHEVVKVPVAHAEQVHGHAVACSRWWVVGGG